METFIKWASKFDIGSVYGERYENFITNFGIILDDNGLGLRDLMNHDPKYSNLSDALNNQLLLAPKDVEKQARKYERYVYALCSMSLINVYRLKYIGKSLPIPELIMTKFNFYGEDMIMQGLRGNLLKEIGKKVRKIPFPS